MCKKLVVLLVALVVFFTACKQENEETVLIGAASSLTNVLDEIGELYSSDPENPQVVFTYGGSGLISQQIKNGAEIDIFLSADREYMDDLVEEEVIKKENTTDLLKNQLVLITSSESGITGVDFDNLLANSHLSLAIGDPDSVPAGRYALEALGEGLLDGSVNYATDVRQVLTWVEKDEIDLGIVYYTDGIFSDDIVILSQLEKDIDIIYPLGLVSEEKESARGFYDFLISAEAEGIFIKHGFLGG